jgi:HPt (histidine-containing phosphotransfer) domain-containing protein
MTLDPAALDSLRELGGDEFVGELVDTFLADAPALLSACRAAHTLKSNGLTLGATGFAEACAELEELARGGDLAGAGSLADRVESEYATLGDALAPFRQT